MEFKRPGSSLYPIIYSSFKVKDSDEVEEYFVQDLTEEYFDHAVDFIVENHAKGAVYHKAARTLDDDSGMQRVREMYRNVFKEKISLVCFKLGSKEIAGINALCIKTRDNFIVPPSTDDENFNLLYEATNYLNRKADVMNFYNVDRVLWAAGLCVDSKLRGRGIATEILKARAPLMKKIGVELTTSLFSTVGAQKAASAASYDENYSIAYEDLQKVFPKMDFSNVLGTTSKILSLKV